MFNMPTTARSWGLAGVLAVAATLAACGESPTKKVDMKSYAEKLAASLSKICPVAKPDDMTAFDKCRHGMGTGDENLALNDNVVLWGGEQPKLGWDKKKLAYIKSDFWRSTYFSLFMFSGKQKILGEGPEGTTIVSIEAYFRNALPPGAYPYPFWHHGDKWVAYETANEIRFYLGADGKAKFVTRAHEGSYDNRGPWAWAPVKPPAFDGQWMWSDDKGQTQPYITLFSEQYSAGNPHLARLDETYKTVALAMRGGDCMACHAPDGHKIMNRLTMLMTPRHAASEIDGILKSVRDNKMPQTEKGDPKAMDPKLKNELLITGEAFKKAIEEANAWERKNQPKNKPTS